MTEILNVNLQDFVSTLTIALLGLLSTFLIACAKKGFDWLSAKIDAIASEKARAAAQDAVKDFEKIVTTTVTSLQQTLVKDIKESIANDDGVYTREDLLKLKDKALESVKAQLTVATKEALSTVYADVDAFMEDMVEEVVFNLKNKVVPEGNLLEAVVAEGTTGKE